MQDEVAAAVALAEGGGEEGNGDEQGGEEHGNADGGGPGLADPAPEAAGEAQHALGAEGGDEEGQPRAQEDVDGEGGHAEVQGGVAEAVVVGQEVGQLHGRP